MSIPRMGSTQAGARVTLGPLPPTPSTVCPLPTLAQSPGADVSSLGKGPAHPGHRPRPVGAIRQWAERNKQLLASQTLHGGGQAQGDITRLTRPQGHTSRMPQSWGWCLREEVVWGDRLQALV